MSAETWTEWGVRYDDDQSISDCRTRDEARRMAAKNRRRPGWECRVVRREVTATEWVNAR